MKAGMRIGNFPGDPGDFLGLIRQLSDETY